MENNKFGWSSNGKLKAIAIPTWGVIGASDQMDHLGAQSGACHRYYDLFGGPTMKCRNVAFLILTVALLAGLQNIARADIAGLQTAAQAHPDLIHQWTFDGADNFARRQDKKGVAHLDESFGGTGTAASLGYDVAGFDGSSQAVSTFRQNPGGDADGHAGFRNPSVTLPPALSYEVVFKPTDAAISGGPFNYGYILNTREGSNRGYFLTQGSSEQPWTEPGTEISSNVGGSWSPANQNIMVDTLQPDHWYFAAGSYEIVNADTVFTNYIADLTAGDTTLTATATTTAPGVYPTAGAPLGIGTRWDGRESFPGVIDEVNMYDAALDGSVFQSHLNELATTAPPSDLTGDGFIDFDDLTILLAHWDQDVSAGQGNLVDPLNTRIDFQDLTFLLADWTGPGPVGSPKAALGEEPVPEPSSLVLALVASFGVCCWRRRRRS